MDQLQSFEEYVSSLSVLSRYEDPTVATDVTRVLKTAAADLARLDTITVESLAVWISEHPEGVTALGLTVGLSQERLKNTLRHHFDTTSWRTLARQRPVELILMLDREFGLLVSLVSQRHREYDFGDVLVARAGTRTTAARAGASGRRLEDEIEVIAVHLGVPYATRTRFTGRNQRSAPCDLVIPNPGDALIVIAAKGFDSTGSKLTDAVREIEEMAEVRLPRQHVIAVIDGIGWKSRRSDLRRIYDLRAKQQIDGLYNLASLSVLESDLRTAAQLRGLLP